MNSLNSFECNYHRSYLMGLTNYETNKIYENNLKKELKLYSNEQYRKWLQKNSNKLKRMNNLKYKRYKIYNYNCN